MNPSNQELPVSEQFEVITYKDTIVFNYTLPEEEKPNQIDREVTLVWEDTLEKFFEAFPSDKPYQIRSFNKEREKNRFIAEIENATEEIIDQVDEEISQKMKFGHFYTSPTYED